MDKDEILSELSCLSIRARVGYGIACIERLADHYAVKSVWLSGTLGFMWRYVSDEWLHEWENEVCDRLGPIIDSFPNPSGRPDVDCLPLEIKRCLLLVEDAATADLYGELSGYAAESLKSIGKVIEIMLAHGLEAPRLEPFKCSPFDEQHGWGSPRPASDYTR